MMPRSRWQGRARTCCPDRPARRGRKVSARPGSAPLPDRDWPPMPCAVESRAAASRGDAGCGTRRTATSGADPGRKARGRRKCIWMMERGNAALRRLSSGCPNCGGGGVVASGGGPGEAWRECLCYRDGLSTSTLLSGPRGQRTRAASPRANSANAVWFRLAGGRHEEPAPSRGPQRASPDTA